MNGPSQGAGAAPSDGGQRESFFNRPALPLDSERLKLLVEFLHLAKETLSIPGVAFGFVSREGGVIEGGCGVRRLGRREPVDASTLFMAASMTKPMTTLLLARLVDEGRLAWDMPVTEAFPMFRLGGTDITAKVRIRHLVSAATGVPRKDLEWIFNFNEMCPEKILALLAATEPTAGFGERFQYSNLMAAVAGFVAGHVLHPGVELGTAYAEAMRDLVFNPVGMLDTTLDFDRALGGNHAAPHGMDAGRGMRPADMDLVRPVQAILPAGGMWSCAHDLLQYLCLELGGGILPDGRRHVSEAGLAERWAPQVKVDANIAYCMGLKLDTTWGVPIVSHGGDTFGYHGDVFWLPDQGVGGVFLTNSDSGWILRRPLMRRLIEVLFDAEPRAAGDLQAEAERHKAGIARHLEGLEIPPNPALASRLAPRYRNPSLGNMKVRVEDGKMIFDTGMWKSEMGARDNGDGTITLHTVSPTLLNDLAFDIAVREGRRVLLIRQDSNEYVYSECPA